MPIFGLLVGLTMLLIIVAIHEFGHMWMARRFDVHVDHYAIGFGPVLKKWKKKDTTYTLRAIPLGGYVMLADEDYEGEVPEGKFKLQDINRFRRSLVMLAGIIFNVVFGILVLAPTYYSQGTPSNEPIVGAISPGSAAEEAGLVIGDYIVSINGTTIEDWEMLGEVVQETEGNTSEMQVRHSNGSTETLMITPKFNEETQTYLIGVSPSLENSWPAAIKGAILTLPLIVFSTVIGILGLFTGLTSASDFVSPIGIAHGISAVAEQTDWKTTMWNIMYFTGIISMAVAAFNLLPVPPLDGGRVLVLAIEAITRRPFNKKIELVISWVVFVALMGLGVYVLLKDTLNWIFG